GAAVLSTSGRIAVLKLPSAYEKSPALRNETPRSNAFLTVASILWRNVCSVAGRSASSRRNVREKDAASTGRNNSIDADSDPTPSAAVIRIGRGATSKGRTNVFIVYPREETIARSTYCPRGST